MITNISCSPGNEGAERFADEALDFAADRAAIYADATTVAPLLLAQQVDGKRPDVKIVSGTMNSRDAPPLNEQTIEQLLDDGTVYVVSSRPGYCPEFVLKNYDLVHAGVLWRVVKR
jgi:hypothetical protein